jgi:hypothetical protein
VGNGGGGLDGTGSGLGSTAAGPGVLVSARGAGVSDSVDFLTGSAGSDGGASSVSFFSLRNRRNRKIIHPYDAGRNFTLPLPAAPETRGWGSKSPDRLLPVTG